LIKAEIYNSCKIKQVMKFWRHYICLKFFCRFKVDTICLKKYFTYFISVEMLQFNKHEREYKVYNSICIDGQLWNV
jgi:hypothetical protein